LPTKGRKEIAQVGAISANGDKEIGDNAASIAGLLLTTECVVVEKKELDKMPPMPGGGGMGGMY
jgi:hypothetical protein